MKIRWVALIAVFCLSSLVLGETADDVNALLDDGAVDDAYALVQELLKSNGSDPAIKAAAERVKTTSIEVFASNLDEARKYMQQGKVATALEFIIELAELARYPEEKKMVQELKASIEAGGTDEASLAAQSLFFKAEAALADEKTDEAYNLLQELVANYIDTEFYKKRKSDIGTILSEIKKAKLSGGSITLAYYEDFDGGIGEWEGEAPKDTSILESGAVQLKFQPQSKYSSMTAMYKNYNEGVMVLPEANGVLMIRYYIDVPVRIHVRLSNKTQNDNFDYNITKPIPGRWVWAQIPLKDFEDAAHEDKKFAKGDFVNRIQISTGPPGVELKCLIDEVAACFGGIPSIYKKALQEEAKVSADYTRDPKKDMMIFDADVIRTVLTTKRDNVRPKSIMIFGDKLTKKIKLDNAGFNQAGGYAVFQKNLDANATHMEFAAQFSAEYNKLKQAPEVVVLAAGYDELNSLMGVLFREKQLAKKARSFGLEPQHGRDAGSTGWIMWNDNNGKIKYNQTSSDQRSLVVTDEVGPKGNPVSCNCSLYTGKGTCPHFEYIKEMVRVQNRRDQYAPNIEKAYTEMIQMCLKRGSIPIIISPALVMDRYKVISEWNYDFKNSTYDAARKANVPYVGLFEMTADGKTGRRMRGSSSGVSGNGSKALSDKIGELIKLLEQYCFRR